MMSGRRLTMMIGLCIIIFGSIVVQVFYFPVFITGFAIMNVGSGFLYAVMPRMIEETVKRKYFGLCIGVMAFTNIAATLLGRLSAKILPDENDTQALADSNLIHLILLGQTVFSLISLSMLLFYFKYDTIKYYLSYGDSETAMKVIDFYFVGVD